MRSNETSNNKLFKILFLRSGGYFADVYFPDTPMIAPPKSILYLAGMFKNDASIDTKMLDALAYPDFKLTRKNRKKPPFYFGMKEEHVIERIEQYQPQIIAITSSANYFFHDTIKLMQNIRLTFPQVFIILGGSDATNDYENYFNMSNAFDVIVMREGESTFKELVTAIKEGHNWKKTKGIAYKENDQLVLTKEREYIEDIDKVKCDYSIVDFLTYFQLNRKGFYSRLYYHYKNADKSIDIVTSRGCSFSCSFCCIHLHMGNQCRMHSVNRVLSEMKELIEIYDIHHFHFEDDNLLHNLDRFKAILIGIIQNGWNITWDTPNGVRADLIDEELIQFCKKSGCTYLIFGIESGSKKVLDEVVKKDIEINNIVKACELCFRYQLDTLAFYILGMPGETKEDLLKTYYFAFDLYKKYKTAPIFQLWRPYRKTPMTEKIMNTNNIAQPMVYNLHKKYRIPYTLFYSKIYEDEEITLEFLAYYFDKYYRDIFKTAFYHWFKFSRKKPIKYFRTILDVFLLLFRIIIQPSRSRYVVQNYLTSKGFFLFASMNKTGTKIKKRN
ncbi:MAG: B12-binding domain-containing radical SAM protein [Bacteroidales bacterium]|nr:B12-binding domain-containing radical SAM protein [Bacteroidales bacterium]